MATWKSENSLLTAKGEEILNKISLGIGTITISRIVAGDGRVSNSALHSQTKVSGNTKNCNINGYNTIDSGTELNFQISNENFTESFAVHQLGVYVTHPDYGGEILYHISQCEENGADVIPALSGNATAFTYSLYLVHGSSSAITINITPLGTVDSVEYEAYKSTVETRFTNISESLSNLTTSFSSFKEGISPNKLITSDENGNLISGGKNTVRGGSISVTDSIAHRALSLSIEGTSTQVGNPTPSAPVYPVDSKVVYVRSTNGTTPKLISFPSTIELRSLGDYRDTIEWDGAKWWKVQRIQEVVLDGTTNGVYYDGNSSKTYCRLAITSGTIYKQIKDLITTAPIVTSHGNTVGETSELYAFYYSSNGGIVGHFLNTVTGVDPSVQTTLQTKCAVVNNWLKAQKDAGTPVKVRYVLKTPIVTEISLTEVLEMYDNRTDVTCSAEGNTVNMVLSYALNTTDETTMYILKSLARKSDVATANSFAVATLIE